MKTADNTGDAGAMVPRGSDAIELRRAAAAARAETTRKVAELESIRQQARIDLELERRRLVDEYERRRAELDAQLAPMQAELAKLVEVAWTVDLYLGRDEQLRLIRDGQPAPEGTPVTIRQRVLSMAEESLIALGSRDVPAVEAVDGMDFTDVPDFIAWLVSDDAHLDRVLPEPKGVVVLVPTWVQSRSGNPWEDAGRNAENSRAYWLIRNGQRLHLLTTDPELKIGANLLPLRDEFADVFAHRIGGQRISELKPGSDEWVKAEAKADARRRHYMRIMLVLQGLADRTVVWHPLPPAGLNLMHADAQRAGHVRIIQDGDTTIQLGDGREPFDVWQRRLNRALRPGLRIVGNFTGQWWRDCNTDYRDTCGRSRVSPANASAPPSGEPLLIEDRKDGGLVVRYVRTDEVWRRYEEPVPGRPGYVYRGERLETPTRRASVILLPDDAGVLPFDLATVADLEYYLNSRENRSRGLLDMVPVIHAALAAKRREADQERSFRVLLAGELIAAGADPNRADELVDELVHWWKVANTWTRPLNGEPDHEAKALRQIVTEYKSRTRAADAEAEVVAAALTIDGVIAVGRDRKGGWFAYAPSLPAHDPGVWLDITPISVDGTVGQTARWQKLQQRTASTLQIVWSRPEWASWQHTANANHYLTGPERDRVVDEVVASTVGTAMCVVEHHDRKSPADRFVAAYVWVHGCAVADMPAEPTSDPLSWPHETRGAVKVQAWRVVKDRAGVRVVEVPGGGPFSRTFSAYTPETPWGPVPWWPDTDTRYRDVRPRLLWADDDVLAEVKQWRDRCEALEAAERDARRKLSEEAYRYVPGVTDAIRADQVAKVRARFDDDFGPGNDDLWESHLASVTLPTVLHARDVWALVMVRLQAGLPVAGCTLDELAEYASASGERPAGEWHHPHGKRVDVGDYGHVVVPDPGTGAP